MPFPAQWVVYMVRCRDTSLYTGISNSLDKRVQRHNRGTGAKYTRSRGPVVLVWWKFQPDKNAAAREERRIKKLTKKQKEAICSHPHPEPIRTRWRPALW